ncbi:MAG: insulinase family protein, partial [Muribaculaceae bacterium]|nr:insulinase family protein [Muribaculaceae bacterium]
EQYHGAYMRPERVHIYLTGKIDDMLLDRLNLYFGRKLETKGGVDAALILEPAHSYPDDERIQIVNVHDAAQSSVRMAIPVIARNHPDYIPLRIATVALGGYFGSRLMSNIREDKGLTYGINAGLYGYREGSMVMIGAQTSNETVGELIEETAKEIERLKTGDMSADELIRLQRFMYTQLLSQLDTSFAIMDYYENLRINDIKGDYFREQCEAINRITAQSISEIAAKYFDLDSMRIAVAGNSEIINI